MRARRLLIVALAALAVPAGTARAAQVERLSPVLVHDADERSPATSVSGSGVPGTEGEPPGPAVYAHVAGPWIQYWLYFAANTQDRGIVRTGRHEGDWEMVQ